MGRQSGYIRTERDTDLAWVPVNNIKSELISWRIADCISTLRSIVELQFQVTELDRALGFPNKSTIIGDDNYI